MRGGRPVRSCLDRNPSRSVAARLRSCELRPDGTDRRPSFVPSIARSRRRVAARHETLDTRTTMSVEAILDAHPRALIANLGVLAACVDECGECAAICTVCADACLAEDDVRALVRCTRLCLDCADACADAGRILAEECRLCERACEEM